MFPEVTQADRVDAYNAIYKDGKLQEVALVEIVATLIAKVREAEAKN